MGWQGQNVFPLLIITAGQPFTGLFVYQTKPGANNLIYSNTAGGGTDPYGNTFLQGATNYTGGPGAQTAVNWNGGNQTFLTAPSQSGIYTQQAFIQLGSANDLDFGTGVGVTRLQIPAAGSPVNIQNADLDISGVGFGLRVKEGANSRLGTATMAAGTITVANTTVGVSTRVLFQRSVAGGTLGFLSRTISAGVSFTINSSNAGDTSQIAWMLVDPG